MDDRLLATQVWHASADIGMPVIRFELGKKADPLAVFHPLTAAPLRMPRTGEGSVTWLVGDASECTTAGLAWLLAECHGQKSILADVARKGRASTPDGAPVQVCNSQVWRGAAPAIGARLREWLLFLNNCRCHFDQTVLPLAACEFDAAARLLPLADRVAVLARADADSLCRARVVLHRARQAGARRSECLWLDAA